MNVRSNTTKSLTRFTKSRKCVWHPIHPHHKWRKTKLVYPDIALRAGDCSLLDATGERIAHLFNTGEDDLIGAWGWRVWIDHKMHEGGAGLPPEKWSSLKYGK